MISQITKDAEVRMAKSVESLKGELQKIRAGRAHTSLLDQIMVNSYGSEMPLNQVASVSVLDARTLSIAPWDKSLIKDIEKAIMSSDLGLNPASTGELIRVPLPPLTEERRKELVKHVKEEGENARIALRNIRRDANNAAKDLLKNKEISEDEERGAENKIQKITDRFVEQVETMINEKEADLMEV